MPPFRLTAPDLARLGSVHESRDLAPVSPIAMLDEIIAHLGAAISQTISTDDQIIAEHYRAAHDLAKLLRKAVK